MQRSYKAVVPKVGILPIPLEPRICRLGAFRVEICPFQSSIIKDAYLAGDRFFNRTAADKALHGGRSNSKLEGWARGRDTYFGSPPGDLRDYETYDVLADRTQKFHEPTPRLVPFLPRTWPSDDMGAATSLLLDCLFRPLEHQIIKSLELTLNVDVGTYTSWANRGLPLSTVRYLRYDPSPSPSGFYVHRDYESFAVLAEDRRGLEIWDFDSQEWIAVNLTDNEVLVTIGELGAGLAPKRLKSAWHRVLIPSSRVPRHAIAFFSAPGFEARIPFASGFPELSNRRVGDHLLRKFRLVDDKAGPRKQ